MYVYTLLLNTYISTQMLKRCRADKHRAYKMTRCRELRVLEYSNVANYEFWNTKVGLNYEFWNTQKIKIRDVVVKLVFFCIFATSKRTTSS